MKENTPIIEELIELRQKLADLLGYKNHASFIHEERMAKSPEKVAQFLSDLAAKLDKLWKDELQVLIKLKKEEVSYIYQGCPKRCKYCFKLL